MVQQVKWWSCLHKDLSQNSQGLNKTGCAHIHLQSQFFYNNTERRNRSSMKAYGVPWGIQRGKTKRDPVLNKVGVKIKIQCCLLTSMCMLCTQNTNTRKCTHIHIQAHNEIFLYTDQIHFQEENKHSVLYLQVLIRIIFGGMIKNLKLSEKQFGKFNSSYHMAQWSILKN